MGATRVLDVTTYVLRSASPAKTRVDAVVVGVVQTAKGVALALGGEDVAAAYGRRLRPLLSTLGVTGGVGEVTRVPTSGTAVNAGLLVLVGLGAEDGLDASVVRRAAGAAARGVPNAASVALALPAETPEEIRAVTEGWLLGAYTFTRYKQGGEKESGPAEVVVLSHAARKAESVAAFEQAQVLAGAVAATRDWVNVTPNHLTPPVFADEVAAAVKTANKALPKGTAKIKVVVHDEKALAELGCGGILSVGAGSAAPPRLVELTYAPKGATTHLALVGKGITYDSGGLTIKPPASMSTMKSDMAGAASVVQALLAIAALGLPIKVSVFAPMAENMISGAAARPGDVVTTYSGRTVEIRNTDAEGRMILCDAITRAVEVEPDVIVDIATLTGHMVVALGDRIGGVLGSDDVVDALVAAGEAGGEVHWPMPITEEVVERMHGSPVADLLQHDWIRWGGGLYAAGFLREFTDGLPWGHLDIAGPSFVSAASGHLTAGGTGFGVATLVDYARALAASD